MGLGDAEGLGELLTDLGELLLDGVQVLLLDDVQTIVSRGPLRLWPCS
jgi:hypothetical protein